ncbi:hypothetical protein [Mucilaginibacter sp. PAMB04168]|uniref:hypothetical protein n=1 Tax=Mucilaginibacter sp. PAMB04168 TaxID=3138567 RepID=UPI0031F6FBDF
MKRFLKPILFMLSACAVMLSCKKDKIAGSGSSSFTADDYTFNRATKNFAPAATIGGQLTSSAGIRFVYCYLIRANATDSLIYVTDNTADNPTNYTLNIPLSSFPVNNMSKATGVKIMAKQTDNSSIQGLIKITYFDPALPQLTNFPASITANLNGGNTAITGTITSNYGLKQVDIYDDSKVENTYELAGSLNDLNGAKTYTLNYAYKYRKAAQHIKVVATDIYNQTNETIINMPVDLAAFKPNFSNFAASITPNLTGTTAITGSITSVTGLKRIDIYDDYQGAYVLVSSISNLNGSLNYTLNYNYTFRRRATNIKLIAFDTDDLQTEKVIPLNITYKTELYRDVFMNAQTTGTSTIFFVDNGTTKGNCDLNASESTMSFLFYGTGTGPAFYSPTNTTNVASNFKCNGSSWVIGNASNFRATRFRVLVPGSTGVDNIYAQYNAGSIDALDDAFFTANGIVAPTGSSARFDATAAATTSVFNTTNAYLIYLRIPDANGITYKNALIRAKEAVSSAGTSTVKFDILVQK